MKNIKFPIIAASLFLLIYQILPYVGAKTIFIVAMFVLSPFVVIWMVIRVLKDGEYKGKELKDEWGYEDYDPYAEKT